MSLEQIANEGYAELSVHAANFEDAMEVRKRFRNRARADWSPDKVDRDGASGIAMINADTFATSLDAVAELEEQAKKELVRAYRRTVPPSIKAWQKGASGIGEHLLARLLGKLHDPVVTQIHYWEGKGAKRTLMAEPATLRKVSDLWSYTGHGDPARRPYKGMTDADVFAMGSPSAKSILWNIANCAIKEPGRSLELLFAGKQKTKGKNIAKWRYRHVYELRRLATRERLHADTCVRCGPSGKPAQSGSPWSDAHKHADALRIVGKEILRDLWRNRYDELVSLGVIESQQAA